MPQPYWHFLAHHEPPGPQHQPAAPVRCHTDLCGLVPVAVGARKILLCHAWVVRWWHAWRAVWRSLDHSHSTHPAPNAFHSPALLVCIVLGVHHALRPVIRRPLLRQAGRLQNKSDLFSPHHNTQPNMMSLTFPAFQWPVVSTPQLKSTVA